MSLQTTFKALADPTRRAILNLLKQQPMKAGDIAAHFNMSQPAVSRHLSVLKEADLVMDQRDGKSIVYEISTTVLEETLLWLQDLKKEADEMSSDCLRGEAS